MKKFITFVFAVGLLPAQSPDLKSASGYLKAVQAQLKNNVVKAAEKMPEESYSFRPSHDIRTFAQLLGHIANAEYNFLRRRVRRDESEYGQYRERQEFEGGLGGRAKRAFGYCEKAHAYLTDDKIAEVAKMGNSERSKFGILAFNNAHTNEHYGNLVTYMRIRGLVPPSSEPR
jgi:uncharacterized damage-inducible protein DinB